MKYVENKIALMENNTFKKYSFLRYNYAKNNQYDIINNFDSYKTIVNNEIDFLCLNQMNDSRKHQRAKAKKHIDFFIQQPDYDVYFATFTYDENKLKLNEKVLNKNFKTENEIKSYKAYILRRRIMEYIGKNICDLIMNVDYGTKNQRLHFHAVIAVKKDSLIKTRDYAKDINGNFVYNKNGKKKTYTKYTNDIFSKYENKIGFYTLEPVRLKTGNTEKDKKFNQNTIAKLSEYINKLVSHSIKVKQSYITTKKGTRYQAELELRKQLHHKVITTKGFTYHDVIYQKYKCYSKVETKENQDKLLNDLITYEQEQKQQGEIDLRNHIEKKRQERLINIWDGLDNKDEKQTIIEIKKEPIYQQLSL